MFMLRAMMLLMRHATIFSSSLRADYFATYSPAARDTLRHDAADADMPLRAATPPPSLLVTDAMPPRLLRRRYADVDGVYGDAAHLRAPSASRRAALCFEREEARRGERLQRRGMAERYDAHCSGEVAR